MSVLQTEPYGPWASMSSDSDLGIVCIGTTRSVYLRSFDVQTGGSLSSTDVCPRTQELDLALSNPARVHPRTHRLSLFKAPTPKHRDALDMPLASPRGQQRTSALAIQRTHTHSPRRNSTCMHVCQRECLRGAREPGLRGFLRVRRGKSDIQGHISSHGSCISAHDLRASGSEASP